MDVDHNASQYTDTDGDSEDELALIEAAAAHFGAGSNGGKRSGTRRSNNNVPRQQQHQQLQQHQQQHLEQQEHKPSSPNEALSTNSTNPMHPAFRGGSMRRQSIRRYSRRASSSRRLSRISTTSCSSNSTVIRRNGNGPYNSTTVVQEGKCTEDPTAFGSTDDLTDPGTTSGGSSANIRFADPITLQHNNRFALQTTNDVPLAVNIGATMPINEADQRMTYINDAVDQSSSLDSLDEDDEIAQFAEMLPREYQRLSNINMQHQQRPSLTGQNCLRGSALSIDSSLMPGNMSGTISRKRRSHQNVADAAAQVASYFRDLSDSEDCMSSNQDEDSSACPTFCSKLSSGSRKTSVTQSSATRRSSGASTTGFSRLSLHNNSYGLEERPRKRRSSSSSISRCDDSIHRLSLPTRRSLTSNNTMKRKSNIKAYNAASAAVAADEAAQRLSEVVEGNIDVHTQTQNNMNAQAGQNIPTRRKFERRAAFVVSSIETEAAAALAERTQLLQKDRYEKVRLKRPQARRSMSYSSGAKMTSSIIASALPEDAETIMENPEVETDFMKLTRSRMERRVLSLPDQNAVVRLSQTSINDDVDFTGDANHQSSALSANLEASAAALRKSFQDGRYQSYAPFQPMPNTLAHNVQGNQNQYDEHYPISMKPYSMPTQQLPSPINFQMPPQSAGGVPLQYATNYLDQNHNMSNFNITSQQPLNPATPNILEQPPRNQNPTVSMLGSSYQVAAEVFNTNAIAAQSLAQTAEVAIAMLHKAQVNTSNSQIISKTRSNEGNNDDFDSDKFDGKVEKVKPISPDTPEEVEASEKIHEAAEKDDVEAMKSIWNSCKEATRMTLNESETGNVALHTATKHGSLIAVDFLLATDADCALIRNGDGQSALHLAVEDGNLTLITAICAISPDSAQVQCEEGFLPLHTSVSSGAQHPDAPQITTILLQNFKHGIHVESDEGLLPIHYTAMSGFTSGVRTILSANYQSIFKREINDLIDESMLPLDFAIDSQQDGDSNNFDTIELLLSSAFYGRVIPRPRQAGKNFPFLPLHGAAKSRPNMKSWQALLNIYSAHAMHLDESGRTIAHILCIPDENNDVDETKELRMLEKVDKKAFQVYDKDGFLPLHRALANRKVSVDFTNKVISLDNDALSYEVKSAHGDSHFEKMLPLHLAAHHDCDLNVIFELTKLTTAMLSKLR